MSADIWLEDLEGNQLEFGDKDWPVVPTANVEYNNNFNLTYNLSPMLKEAGMPSWSELIHKDASEAGAIWLSVVNALVSDPTKYKAMNPKNGWGTYEDAVQVLTALVVACNTYPDALIGGWL